MEIRRHMPLETLYVERLFRESAGLDIKKHKDRALLISETILNAFKRLLDRGLKVAKTNDREYLIYEDLPISRSLEEHMEEFKREGGDTLEAFLSYLSESVDLPPMEDDLRSKLHLVLGGLTVCYAKVCKLIGERREAAKDVLETGRDVILKLI